MVENESKEARKWRVLLTVVGDDRRVSARVAFGDELTIIR